MTMPGPDHILSCPHCKALLKCETIMSGNTLGSKWWSDSKFEAPMLPESPAVTRCNSCRKVFWLEDAHNVGVIDWCGYYSGQVGKPPKRWLDAKTIEHSDENALNEAIEQAVDLRRQKYLRIKLWHIQNDPFRGNGRYLTEASRPPTFAANLESLLPLLNDSDAQERIMKAEICRELGRFDEAVSILTAFCDDLEWMAKQILARARDGNYRVEEIQMSEMI